MTQFEWATPEAFWLFLLFPVIIAWWVWVGKRARPSLEVSRTTDYRTGWRGRLYPILRVLRLAALAAMIIALARPQDVSTDTQTRSTRGIDIVMAVDVSLSMLAQDLKPNRLEATKAVASDFVRNRPGDRIGIVVYAAESYTKTPVTTDQSIVLRSLDDIRWDPIIQNGTAIGMGLSTAINRLKDSETASKVIILLTDGENNSGLIDPQVATDLAVNAGIKVYTIGVGTRGTALSPTGQGFGGRLQFALMEVNIDEPLLKEIAAKTGGQYFRAGSDQQLREIYDEIDQLEKSELEEITFTEYSEQFRPWLLLAFGLLIFEALLRYTLFKTAT